MFLPSFLDIGPESLSLPANFLPEGCQNLILRVQRSILGKYIILTTCLSGFRNTESNFAALSKPLAVGFYKLSALCYKPGKRFLRKHVFSIISGHWSRISRPCGKFFTVGLSKIRSAGRVEYFEEKLVFENLFFIVFVP